MRFMRPIAITTRTCAERIQRRLTYANVATTIALFFALSGGVALATDTIPGQGRAIERRISHRALALGVALALFLLAAAAGAAFAAPRTMGDGAWCWFADPRGVRFDGLHKRTYVGW